IAGGGSSIVTVDSGSTLNLNGSITNDSSRTLILQGAGTGVVNGVIAGLTGTTSVTINNSGTWALAGVNPFSGALTVEAGTLSIGTINNVSTSGTLGNSATAVTLGSSGATGTL